MPRSDSTGRSWARSAWSIFRKDWSSELRTRYAINALLMFVVTTISVILFSLGSEGAPQEALAGMLWVVIFFASMSGLARTFVAEEERGTSLTLQLMARPSAVLAGKLLFNLVLVLALNTFTTLLYSLFVSGFVVRNLPIFVLTVLLGSVGLAVASTIIAAIIARANTKGTLYPVLSFPIVLPLLLTVVNATKLAGEPGVLFQEALDQGVFQVLLSYIVVVLTASYLMFDYVWKD
jgi:heme exporter protein B